MIDRRDSKNYYGRTEFDSPEVDNEVIIPEEMNEKSASKNISANVRKELFESANITKPQSPSKSTRKSPSIDEITISEIPKLDKQED